MSVSRIKADFSIWKMFAGLHIGAAVSILYFDPLSVDDLDPPWVIHLLTV